jgi:Cdc6-like AAA superfamily ATPase
MKTGSISISQKENCEIFWQKENCETYLQKIICLKMFRSIIGNAARKDQFFPRPKIRKAILDALELNQNILISSPRRVGKTSVILNLVDAPDEHFYAVYLNTEGIDNSEKFFQQILARIFDLDNLDQFGKFTKEAVSFFKSWGERIAAIKIAGAGIDLTQAEKSSHFDQLKEFLDEAELGDKQIVLLLDEFPVTLENILKK